MLGLQVQQALWGWALPQAQRRRRLGKRRVK
jgi:hypothetical protein